MRDLQYVEVNGVRLAYDDFGEDPAILFIHGFMLDARCGAASERTAGRNDMIARAQSRGASALVKEVEPKFLAERAHRPR